MLPPIGSGLTISHVHHLEKISGVYSGCLCTAGRNEKTVMFCYLYLILLYRFFIYNYFMKLKRRFQIICNYPSDNQNNEDTPKLYFEVSFVIKLRLHTFFKYLLYFFLCQNFISAFHNKCALHKISQHIFLHAKFTDIHNYSDFLHPCLHGI